MTVDEIKDAVMHQTGNDTTDATEYAPFLLGYINEGYEKVVYASAKVHVASDSATYPSLSDDADEPNLAEWMQAAIVNWATWCLYRNGNPSKQSRGMQFRAAAEEVLSQIRGGAAPQNFYNMPT